jgi:hypothetical protein
MSWDARKLLGRLLDDLEDDDRDEVSIGMNPRLVVRKDGSGSSFLGLKDAPRIKLAPEFDDPALPNRDIDDYMQLLAHELQHYRDATVDEKPRKGETQEEANARRRGALSRYYIPPTLNEDEWDEDDPEEVTKAAEEKRLEEYKTQPQEVRAYARQWLQRAHDKGYDILDYIRRANVPKEYKWMMYKLWSEPEKWEGQTGDFEGVISDQALKG